MIYEKFESLTTDRMVRALIGISRKQFDELVTYFSSAFQTIQEERLANGEIKQLPVGGKKLPIDTPEKQLFFVLYYLKTYPTFDVLGFHFDMSAGHAHDAVVSLLRVLEQALLDADVLPEQSVENSNEFRQLVDSEDKIIMDGMECPCVRPTDETQQKECYSGKKKRHTVKSLVISTTTRWILFISAVFGGRAHDYAMMKNLLDPSVDWFQGMTVELDLGFLGAQKDYGTSGTIFIPHKKPRRSNKNPDPQLTETQKATNRDHAGERVLVEHAIGGMKQFFCLTHRIRNQSVELMNKFVLLSAGLWNYKIS